MATGISNSGSGENNGASLPGSTLTVKGDNSSNLTDVFTSKFDKEWLESLLIFGNNLDTEEKFQELSLLLKKIAEDFENKTQPRISYINRTKKILEEYYSKYKAKYKALENLFAEWKPIREKLIEKLSLDIQQLDRNYKWSNIVRVLASSAEVSGTVGGLMFRSETGWTNHALNVASFCGLFGVFATVAEVAQSKRILGEVSEAIENDQKLLLPIFEWFKESKDLDSIVQDLFPHGIDTEIVQQIQAVYGEQEDYLKIFRAGFMSNVKKNNQLLENVDFLQSLELFSLSEVAVVWWHRIIYRKHPIILELGKMTLQREFGLQSILYQSIPALPLEQQRLTSLPVAGRIMLNLLTLCDSFGYLKKGAKSSHSDKLRKQLENMQEQLEMIEDTVGMKPRTP